MAQRLILLVASSLLAASALAQQFADPTRPPTRGAAAPRQSVAAPSRLQSVLISPSRSVAIIDGRSVRLGERVGDAILVSVEPSQVTLQRGAERQRLTLLPPAVEKMRVRQ